MLRKFTISSAIISMLIAAMPLLVFAQSTDPKRERKAQEVKQKIQRFGTGQSAVVKVKLYNDTEYKGYVSRAGEEDFDITDKTGKANTVRYADVRSIGGKNMSSGAKIAIGIGIGAAITLLVLVLIFNEITENN